MYPHERSLVARLADKPFALLGINSDPDLQELKKVIENEQMTWRSWWDVTTGGPIATSYNVDGWPTIYVLDHHGVIRHIDIREKKLDAAVDELLAELEKEKK